MVKLSRFFYAGFTFAILFLSINLNAQVQISGTNYSTLKAAFDAINAGTYTGAITATVIGNTTETVAAVLNASGNGSANYTSVTIYPTVTATISGSVANGLIELRGADNVTIDGRIGQTGSTNSLTVQNNYTAANACAIWLDSLISGVGAGASNNIIRNCNIIGGANNTSYCHGIVLSSSSSLSTGAYGNSNNQILYNKVEKAYYGIRAYSLTGYPNWQTANVQIKYNTLGSSANPIGYYAIYAYACRNAQITDNIVNYQNYAGGYGMYLYYNFNMTINNNLFENTSNTSTYYGMYCYYDTSATITNNTMRNITTTGSMYEMYVYYCPSSSFSGNSCTGITIAASFYGLYLNYVQSSTISNNIVDNISCNGTSGTFYGLYLYYGDNSTATGNTISNVLMMGTTYGIINSTTTSPTYSRNKIFNLRSNNISGYAVDGLYISAGSSATITNNVIYNLTSTNYSATSTVYNPFGINITSGTGHRVYNNSVNLYGSQSGSNTVGTLSAAFIISATAVNSVDVRNNSFANSLTGLTGSISYAIYIYSSSNLTGSTFNYNDYYASGTYAMLGFQTSNRTDIAGWRSATGQDVNSFASTPSYNSNNNLRPLSGSALLNSGTPITSVVPTDFLSVTRSTTTPTVGAYEQAGDFAGPDITFTALPNTTSTSNRVVSGIAMTDFTGINTTSGTAPRLYYRKSTGANSYNDNTSATDGWKWVETTSSSSPFSFTIDYSKIYGGVPPGTGIDYFFVSQDVTGSVNIGSSLSGFAVSPSSVSLTSTNFPVSGFSNYQITAVLSGTYTVGSGGTFLSLTSSGGVFSVINAGQVSGDVTFQIISDLTSETGANALNAWTEIGGSGYTLSIVPGSATTRTISGSVGAGLIKVNGASRVVFDGRYGGSGNYLTFSNTSTSSSAAFHIASTSTTGLNNITIRNCNIYGGIPTTSTVYAIYLGGSTIASAGDNLDNINILNNNIYRAYNTIYVYGTTANLSDNLVISGNNIGSYTAADKIGFKAVHLNYVNNANLTKNVIFGITQTSSWDAVYITTGVTNSNFTKNTFKDLMNNGSNRLSGFYIGSGTGSNLTFANNEFYNMINNGTSGATYGCYGFYLAAGGGYNIYHNSILFTGDRDALGTYYPSSPSAGIYILSGVTAVNIKNNLLFNNQTSATNPTTAKNYCIYNAGANTQFSSINNNDYYFSGSQGYLGYQGADITSLSAWQSATGQDANSISSEPALNNTNVLVPLPNSPLLSAGGTGTGITDDYLGVTRSTTAPTIGAYERGADVSGPIMSITPITNTALTSNRTLTNLATITDYSGVNTTTFAPRLYFRKSTDANTYAGNTSANNGWKYVIGSLSGNNCSFTLNYSLLQGGTVSVNDIIEYFVIAQDVTAGTYTSYKNGSLAVLPTSVALTSTNFPMSSANSFTIVPSMSGTINVGIGQTYTSLSRSDGAFNKLNGGVLTGDVIINITSNLSLEDGSTALNEIPSEGGVFNILIKPANAINYSITGASSTSLIRFNGTDRITLDGSYSGSGNYLTFTNTSTSGTIAAIQVASNTTGANYVTIKNCNMSTGFNTGTSIGLYIGDLPISTSGTSANCDNLTIQNNVISKAYYGLYVSGSTSGMLDNLLIENNKIGSDVNTEYVTLRGIVLKNAESPIVRTNTIFNLQSSSLTDMAGIEIGGTLNNGYISRNRIYSIKNANSSG